MGNGTIGFYRGDADGPTKFLGKLLVIDTAALFNVNKGDVGNK